MTNFQEKKDFSGQKKKLGLRLREKKRIFGPKIGKKFENQVQKLSNFKGKKDFFGQKNKLGLSLRTKKGIFGQKIYQFKKKGLFRPKKTSWG